MSIRFVARAARVTINNSIIAKMSSSSGSGYRPLDQSANDSDHETIESDPIHQLLAKMDSGLSPRVLLNHLAPSLEIPQNADEMSLWKMIVSMIEPPKRKKLVQYNTIEDAIDLIKKSKKIVVLSGAGISTSAGLPDFRSRNGIYVQIHAEHPDLHDPKCMFDIQYFRRNPLPFYQFAKALFPGQFRPTIGHEFIKSIEDHGKLLRNYTQNIDTLEKQAGIRWVVECHGSFAKASCTNCKHVVDGESIREEVFAQKVPLCPECPRDGLSNDRPGVLKPNIVFFGEQLGNDFHNSLEIDKDQVDLLIVIGSSLKVRPVALIPRSIPKETPQILINKEPLDHMDFDIELLGDCDHIIQELCHRLGDDWTKVCESNTVKLTQLTCPVSLKETKASDSPPVVADCDADNGDEDESDWTDIEVIDDSSDGSNLHEKADVDVPEASFIFVKPNKYFFMGAELTRKQFKILTN